MIFPAPKLKEATLPNHSKERDQAEARFKKAQKATQDAGPPEACLIDYAAVGPPFRAKDLEHEARTRDAAKNHPRMDGASEGQATDRRAGQALRQEVDGANPVQWRSVPADNELAVAPHR